MEEYGESLGSDPRHLPSHSAGKYKQLDKTGGVVRKVLQAMYVLS